MSPTVGKFWTPEKPIRFNSSRNTSILRNGSVPLTPASTGVWRTTGSTSRRHIDDDLVRVAVGQ